MKETGLGSSTAGGVQAGGSTLIFGGAAVGLMVVGVAGWVLINPASDVVEPIPVAVVVVEPQDVPAVVEVVEKPVVAEEPVTIIAQPEETVELITPSFDVVRVDKDGNALIAGNGIPNKVIVLMAGDIVLAETKTDSSGGFVFQLDMPASETPIELRLEQATAASVDSVLVMPRVGAPDVAPKIVVADAQSVVVVQDEKLEAGPDVTQDLSLDTINYSNEGNVVLTGRASSNQSVRVYVDNKPVSLGRVESGSWSFEIPEIKDGVYTLRVDALDDAGKVTERVESPFQRVTTEPVDGAVTIQPGFTLWELAQQKYGSGDRFIQIYEANKDIIKDPNMIFPGQVFDLPDN